MWFANFCILIISTFSVHLTVAQSTIRRGSNGDYLFAIGLDCSLHAATKTANDTCFCGSDGSYFTDRNNKTQCFTGRGQAELGKRIVLIFLVCLCSFIHLNTIFSRLLFVIRTSFHGNLFP